MINLDLDGQARVVDEYQVETLTRMGWCVKAMYKLDNYTPVYENGTNKYVTSGSQVKFILGRSKDEEIAAARADRDCANKAFSESKKVAEEAQIELKRVKVELDSRKGELNALQTSCANERTKHAQLQEKARKMELHLGKVRESIGTKAFKEIVGDGD